MMNINKVAVIGAGTMGSGIAGQIANAGHRVLLLDIAADGDDANAYANAALERLKSSNPPGIMSDEALARIEVGNIKDDLERISDCDWVAEAVVERLDVKLNLYNDVARHLRADAILTSNTSTIPISLLTQGMAADLQKRFAITHFFNPVRFMRLMELVRGETTSDAVMQTLEQFCEQKLGKGIVPCADTPGFIANRVGVFALQCALHEAFNANIRPEIADALFGRPMGIPKTGVFGLYDLIGIDLMADVAKSLEKILPENDRFHAYAAPISQVETMLANDQRGNKSGRGFYIEAEGMVARKVIDFTTGNYNEFKRPDISIANEAERNGVRILVDDNSAEGRFAWRVLSEILVYAASIIPEIGSSLAKVDEAMRLGYNWLKGPFELIDEIGLPYFIDRLLAEGRDIPPVLTALQTGNDNAVYRVNSGAVETRHWDGKAAPHWQTLIRRDGILRFSEVRKTLVAENACEVASWFDYEGCALVEFHSKANALEADSMAILHDALNQASTRGLSGVLVHNDAQHFSCGVNLGVVREFILREDFDGLDGFLVQFQQTVHQMANSDLTVVAAPVGLSIGGGFEVVLHAQHVISHANSVLGLVETGVGVIPSGGGCKEMLYRWIDKLSLTPQDITQAAWKTFMNIGYGRTATAPTEADRLAMRRADDQFVMNRDRLLSAGMEYIRANAQPKHAPRPGIAMPGQAIYAEMVEWLEKAHADGHLTPHDITVGSALATIVTGGEETEPNQIWQEQDLFNAERKAFLTLAQTEATLQRINALLDEGLTLRN